MKILRKLAAVCVVLSMFYFAIDRASAVDLEPQQEPTAYPYPTYEDQPTGYPGPGETITPQATSPAYPGPTPAGTGTVPAGLSATINPSQSPFQLATPAITTTVIYRGTPTLLPVPSLELLFPDMLPQTPSPTPDATEAAAASTGEDSSTLPPGVLLLGAVVVLIWGLLGAFLAIYLRRIGY